MGQNYKVYFGNRPVFFTQTGNSDQLTGAGYVVLNSSGKSDTMLIEQAISRGAKGIVLNCANTEESWKSFSSQFEFVQAAGGVVMNHERKVLFIFRMEKWDLPKGKVEDGEQIKEAALREVEEECSIGDLTLEPFLIETWHTYIQKGEPILKSTHWYLMQYNGTDTPKPQLQEGITETRWLDESAWDIVRKNTYPSVLDVMEAYQRKKK